MTSRPFTLLHCADLHLDAVLGDSVRSSVSVDLTSEERVILRDAPINALDRIGAAALDYNVDCVVIAGDIFDSRDNATKEQRIRSRFTAFLTELCERKIDVVITLGNHDPVKSIQRLSKSWPSNVRIFSSQQPETFLIERDGQHIALHGASYATNDETRDLAVHFPNRIEDAINVGVLHTNVGGDTNHSNYAPSTIATLTSHHYDYFALGHVHKRHILSSSPHVAYSGNSQGLSAKPSEQEAKGCVIVRIDAPLGHVESTFVETDSVRYISCSLHAEDFLEEDDIITYAANEIASLCPDEEMFYLVRASIDVFGSFDADEMCAAINDSRTNYFVTSLKTTNSYRSFEELINHDPFFESVQKGLEDVRSPSCEDLYGSRAATMSRYLADNANDDIRDEAAQVILGVASRLEQGLRS